MQVDVIGWLGENRSWLFSGIGIAVPLAIVGWLLSRGRAKRDQSQRSGAGSSNLQAGGDINLLIGTLPREHPVETLATEDVPAVPRVSAHASGATARALATGGNLTGNVVMGDEVHHHHQPTPVISSAGCPRVIMQFIAAAQLSTFELLARSADAFEVEVQPLVCGDGVIGWSLPKTVLLSGESMSATICEIGKSGNAYYHHAAPLLLERALDRVTSPDTPIIERSILITYRAADRQQWQTECPIRYDRRIGKTQLLTPVFSPQGNATLADQKTLDTLRKLLPNEGGIMPLRNQPFWGKFPWDSDAVLLSFLQRDTGPDHAFLDEHLEGLRQRLHEAIALLLDRVHRYSDPPSEANATTSGKFRLFWKGDNKKDVATYDARRYEVIEAAKNVCEIYDDLVLTARRKFET